MVMPSPYWIWIRGLHGGVGTGSKSYATNGSFTFFCEPISQNPEILVNLLP
jgi:hypothetical protein